MEVAHFLGVLDDLRHESTPALPMRSYKLPGGTEIYRQWTLFQPPAPTPDRPYVRTTWVSGFLCR